MYNGQYHVENDQVPLWKILVRDLSYINYGLHICDMKRIGLCYLMARPARPEVPSNNTSRVCFIVISLYYTHNKYNRNWDGGIDWNTDWGIPSASYQVYTTPQNLKSIYSKPSDY